MRSISARSKEYDKLCLTSNTISKIYYKAGMQCYVVKEFQEDKTNRPIQSSLRGGKKHFIRSSKAKTITLIMPIRIRIGLLWL